MSLLTSTNFGAPSQAYFVPNAGTASTVIIPAAIERLQGNDVQITSTATAPAGILRLGPNPISASAIVLSDGPTTAAVNGTLSVNGSLVAKSVGALPASLDTYINRDIHGFSDTGYFEAFSAPQGSGPIPNPGVLPVGLYSVIATAPGDPNIGAQVSATCYWTGAAWLGSGVSTSFTGGAPNTAILPVAGSAQLSLGGVAVPANTVVAFRQLLAAPNL